LIADLAESGESFTTTSSETNTIASYEPGRRIRLDTGFDSVWVDVESIRGCWDTLERQGQISRRDVLEPGRRSAFMMALFARLDCVREEQRDELYLVLDPQG
jgi:hypothetical protein